MSGKSQSNITTKAKFLCNLCDCVSIGNKGDQLVQDIFQQYPYSNCYSGRLATKKSQPGTLQIKGDGKKNRYVVNLFVQFYPGPPKYPNDNIIKRLEWFGNCLDKLLEVPDAESFSFPGELGLYSDFDYTQRYQNLIDDFRRKYLLRHQKPINIVDYLNNNYVLDVNSSQIVIKYEKPIEKVNTQNWIDIDKMNVLDDFFSASDNQSLEIHVLRKIDIANLKYIVVNNSSGNMQPKIKLDFKKTHSNSESITKQEIPNVQKKPLIMKKNLPLETIKQESVTVINLPVGNQTNHLESTMKPQTNASFDDNENNVEAIQKNILPDDKGNKIETIEKNTSSDDKENKVETIQKNTLIDDNENKVETIQKNTLIDDNENKVETIQKNTLSTDNENKAEIMQKNILSNDKKNKVETIQKNTLSNDNKNKVETTQKTALKKNLLSDDKAVETQKKSLKKNFLADDTDEEKIKVPKKTALKKNNNASLHSLVIEPIIHSCKSYDKNPNWKKTISELASEINDSWDPILKDPSIMSILCQLDHEFEKELNAFGDHIEILPSPQELIFQAFNQCEYPPKVTILGQDPYFSNLNEAMGLSFSVPNGVEKPPTLLNIFKELSTDIEGFKVPISGDLTRWAQQGVLLLNTALTVRYKQKESHLKIWKAFTDKIIELLSQKADSPMVFILWGGSAKLKKKLIKNVDKHLILEATHPSPLGANKGGFFDCKHFSKTNQFLAKNKIPIVDWNLN